MKNTVISLIKNLNNTVPSGYYIKKVDLKITGYDKLGTTVDPIYTLTYEIDKILN